MTARIALLLVAVAPAFAQDQELAAVLDRTVNAWVERNKIEVTAAARRAMHAEAQSLRRVLLDLEAANPVREKWSAVAMVVRHYCFELRDSLLRGRRRVAIPTPALGFQEAAALTIDAADVQRSTLREVLERILGGLRPKPVGYIELRSTPDRGEILINRQPRGFTNRVYVITTGSYEIEIRRHKAKPCQMRVTVQPAATAIAACDS